MTTPLTTSDMHRLREEIRLRIDAKSDPLATLCNAIISTFPLSPNATAPTLPWGCVLWGPDEEGLYEIRNASGTLYWGSGDKWMKVAVQTGLYARDLALKYIPSTPPPDWKETSPTTPDDWRKECVLELKGNGQWDVESPCRKFWLDISEGWMSYAKTATSSQFGVHISESSARAALAKAPPYPGYTKGKPCSSESSTSSPAPTASSSTSSPADASGVTTGSIAPDGTVDAAYVAANAGEYKVAGDPGRFSSDGGGNVSYSAHIHSMSWCGVHYHTKKGTRFRPHLPATKPSNTQPNRSEPYPPSRD